MFLTRPIISSTRRASFIFCSSHDLFEMDISSLILFICKHPLLPMNTPHIKNGVTELHQLTSYRSFHFRLLVANSLDFSHLHTITTLQVVQMGLHAQMSREILMFSSITSLETSYAQPRFFFIINHRNIQILHPILNFFEHILLPG